MIAVPSPVLEMYEDLLKRHGPQGWWPLLELHHQMKGTNPTKTGSVQGYHPGDFSYPHDLHQKFEICLGAILTQNTAWPNVEKALLNLKALDVIDPHKILEMSEEILKGAIRSAGYFNQKARKIKVFSEFFVSLKGRNPTREQLLGLWGIGPETADSILLYAYKQPLFVVDAYTRRIFSEKGLFAKDAAYDEIKAVFEAALPKDWKLYQEYHALLVEQGKNMRILSPKAK
ncbi:endonuclease III domain-containing protein [Candidatus Woesearchaeota archaeon]|nr:endonuclease III domain-containing protein [Candidatus Woesearchaeota archaeon]